MYCEKERERERKKERAREVVYKYITCIYVEYMYIYIFCNLCIICLIICRSAAWVPRIFKQARALPECGSGSGKGRARGVAGAEWVRLYRV
jgi:lipopolysaccharide/colanic/teichoic acid biosynthesis glycosyltransferase